MIKRIVAAVFSEFVYGSHLLSIGASGIVLCLLLILDLPIAYQALLIPYLSSQIVYTYNHLSEGSADELSNPERTKHVKKSKRKGHALLLMYVATLLLVSLTTNIDTVLVLISIVFGGVLYTLALKDFGARYIVGFKNIYTSVFWGMTVLLVPALYQLQIDLQILYFGIFVFLRWVVNSTYFDIKDEISDSKRSLKTLPVVVGRKNTIRLLHLVNLLSIVPIVLGYISGQYDTEVLIMSVFVVYGFIYLAITSFLREKDVRLLSYIVVDSEYAFWPIAFFLGSLFLG